MIKSYAKKTLSALLAVLLVLSLMPVVAFADGGNVAQIGETQYATLADAVAAANAAGTATIKLIDDFDIDYSGYYATINSGSNITIDLNGKKVTSETTAAAGSSLLWVNYGGTLTITDTSTDKDGSITTNATQPDNVYWSYFSNLITNRGTLIVEAGTLDNTTNGGAAFAIDAASASKTTINGGLVKAFNTAVRVSNGYSNTGKAEFTLNDGEIYGYTGIWVQMQNNDGNNATVSVNGGSIISRDANGNMGNYAFYDTGEQNDKLEYSVTGGSIDGNIWTNEEKFITGGTFNNNIVVKWGYVYLDGDDVYDEDASYNKADKFESPWDSKAYWEARGYMFEHTSVCYDGEYCVTYYDEIDESYIADDFKEVATSVDGYIKIVSTMVAQIGETKYASLAEAVAAANAAGTATTIKLIADFNIDYTGYYATINSGSDVTIDLNGKKVTSETTAAAGSSLLWVNYGGTLTITDTSTDKDGSITTNATQPDNVNWSYFSNLITNRGTLIVEAGTLDNTTNGGAAYAIDAASASKTTINGGLVKAFNTAVRVANSYGNTGNAEFTFNDGEIYGLDGIWVQVNGGTNGATINVGGGKITCRNASGAVSGYALYDQGVATYAGPIEYNISGGVFDASYSMFSYGADVDISDGVFVAPVYLYTNRAASNTVTQNGGMYGSYFYVRDYTTGTNVRCEQGGYFRSKSDANYCVNSNNMLLDNPDYNENETDPASKAYYPYMVVDAVCKLYLSDADGTYYVNCYSCANAIENAVAYADYGYEDFYIYMLSDETIPGNNGVEIPAGLEIVLDLNGHTVKNAVNENKGSQVITNKGSLTITDTSDAKTGLLTNAIEEGTAPGDWWSTPQYNYATNVITNMGTLTVEAGTIRQTAASSICYAIDNNSNATNATVNMNGGTVESAITAIRQFCGTGKENTVNVTDGTISGGNTGIWIQLPSSTGAPTAALNVTGGTISGGSYAFYDYSYGQTYDNVNYNLDGGTFDGDYIFSYGANIDISGGTYNCEVAIKQDSAPSDVSISGGTFNGEVYTYGANASEKFITGGMYRNTYYADIEPFLDDDYKEVAANVDGYFTVAVAAARIGEETYMTLEAALDAAVSGDTVVLISDITNEKYIDVEAGITLDLNGHNITGAKFIYVTGDMIDTAASKGIFSAATYVFTPVGNYLPIYDSNRNGYTLNKMAINVMWETVNGTDIAITFASKKEFGDTAAAFNLLKNADNGYVKAAITIYYKGETSDIEQTFLIDDVHWNEYINDYLTQALYVRFTGVDEVEGTVSAAVQFISYTANGQKITYLPSATCVLKD